jgi:hypothetical protein
MFSFLFFGSVSCCVYYQGYWKFRPSQLLKVAATCSGHSAILKRNMQLFMEVISPTTDPFFLLDSILIYLENCYFPLNVHGVLFKYGQNTLLLNVKKT